MNAIDLLIKQHEITKNALEEMEKGNVDEQELRTLADELVAHMVIEEHVFYPRVRELMKDMVGESFEEHTVARFALARAMLAKGEDQKARITVLKELIEHHVEEEEQEMFPKVRQAIDAGELERLGERMEAMFDKAVELGIESLVTGQSQELRTVNGSMNGLTKSRSQGQKQQRASR